MCNWCRFKFDGGFCCGCCSVTDWWYCESTGTAFCHISAGHHHRYWCCASAVHRLLRCTDEWALQQTGTDSLPADCIDASALHQQQVQHWHRTSRIILRQPPAQWRQHISANGVSTLAAVLEMPASWDSKTGHSRRSSTHGNRTAHVSGYLCSVADLCQTPLRLAKEALVHWSTSRTIYGQQWARIVSTFWHIGI